MNDLTRALEMIALMPKCNFTITKYSPLSYIIQAEDLEFGTLERPERPKKASGSGTTLEQAAKLFVLSAQRQGFIGEDCPETQPGGNRG